MCGSQFEEKASTAVLMCVVASLKKQLLVCSSDVCGTSLKKQLLVCSSDVCGSQFDETTSGVQF